ncbi:MAG: M28 family peptidase [Bacteroidia bacterium]|nr:M28 family peptidase [Bacteroidia bacterium]
MKNIILIFVIFNLFLIKISASDINNKTMHTETIISNCLSEINADSIRSTMLALENMGTRYYLANNRKAVAVWIRSKFQSYGYNNAYIDSFEVTNSLGTTMQYNVVATLEGTTNPEIFYAVGAHHDCSSNSTPLLLAPGADDNASGTAATLEIARILKKTNFHSVSSIRFITFALEEGGLRGSEFYALKARKTNQDLRMLINCDMISNAQTPAPWTIHLQKYDNSAWVSSLAKYIILNYTLLQIHEVMYNSNQSDSYSFFSYHFPTIFLEELEFSNFYHSNADTVGNCNVLYCAEITKVACGMLLQQSLHPEVVNVQAVIKNNYVKVLWNKSKETNVIGYNVYKSLNPASGFTKLNSAPINNNDTIFIDPSPTPLIQSYYSVVTLDSGLVEGEIFNYDSVMKLPLNQGILIVDDSKNEYLNPIDSVVDSFYDSLFSAYTIHKYDIEASGALKLSDIGNYSTVIFYGGWFTQNSPNLQNVLKYYLKSGGNLLITVNRFHQLSDWNNSNVFYPNSICYDFLKCDSFYVDNNSCFFKANPLSSGYPTMQIDTLKTPTLNNHHLRLIEALYKQNDANYIYSYDTKFDSSSVQGSMKGMPIGIEYIGNDYKLIELSFALWYMNFNDAKAFINYTMQNVFNETSSVPETNANIGNNVLFNCYPNPFSSTTTIKYYLSESDNVNLAIYDITGKLVSELVNKPQSFGAYTYTFNSEKLNNGIYFCKLKTTKYSETTKMVLLK